MTATESRLGRVLAYLRAHGVKLVLEIVANFLLPFLVYSYGSGSLGPLRALMVASAPPILWSVAGFVRERKLDAISIIVLAGIGLSLLAFAGGGGLKVLQLRENLVAGLVGLIFLGSAAIGRPLIYQLARAGMRRRLTAEAATATFEVLGADLRFRRQMTAATLVWGLGLFGLCAGSCGLVFALSVRQYLVAGPVVGYGTIGLLTAWTFWYVPRAISAVAARRMSPQA